jgi:hypothetical protein
MSNCIHCKKPIILVPSAEERAAKDISGRPASFYRNLFTEHSECALEKRKAETTALMQSQAK